MYICPEATLLSVADNGTLMQGMLLQAQEMGTAMCIFDVIGGANPDPILYTQDIQTFRDSTGNTGLEYGASYYPFIGTTIMQQPDIDFTNLFGGDTTQLAPLLNPPSAPNAAVAALLEMIQKPPADPMTNSQLQAALLVASPLYSQIVTHVLSSANTLPQAAPSRESIPSTTIPTGCGVRLQTSASSGLPACRFVCRTHSRKRSTLMPFPENRLTPFVFQRPGHFDLGARTLDGNSQDWRYVSVRRTMTFLEQSVKLAARQYIFSPNTSDTWLAVKSMITSFLMGVWRSGGLQGSSPADAFQVNVGLGSTMTADDVLNGYLRVSVLVATVRPAEFLVIMFQQEQAKSA